MVYIGNIISLHKNMKDNEIMRMGFRSGKSITQVYKNDELISESGDLKITRINKLGRCIMFVDTAEVETVNIITMKGDLNGN